MTIQLLNMRGNLSDNVTFNKFFYRLHKTQTRPALLDFVLADDLIVEHHLCSLRHHWVHVHAGNSHHLVLPINILHP